MNAACKLCGQLVASMSTPKDPEGEYRALGVAMFSHLRDHHGQQSKLTGPDGRPVELAGAPRADSFGEVQRAMGAIGQFVASLFFDSADARFTACREAAREFASMVAFFVWVDEVKSIMIHIPAEVQATLQQKTGGPAGVDPH
jgi:hypothetical protein